MNFSLNRKHRPVSAVVLAMGTGALLALAGCAGSSGSSASAASPNHKVTITFWNSYNETDQEVHEVTKVLIPKFEKENPGITVQNVTLPETNMNEKIITDAAGGQLPDVARVDIAWEPVFAGLHILVPENNLDGYSALSKEVYPGSLSTNKYQGSMYGLPLDTNTKVLFSNTKLLAEHGIKEPPSTMSQFVTDIKECTSGSGADKVYGFIDGAGTDIWGTIPWIASFGGSITNKALDSASGHLNSTATLEGLGTLVNLEKEGYVTGLLPGATGDLVGMADNKFCMMDEGPWEIPTAQTTYPNLQYKLSLFPTGPGGSREPVGGEDIAIFHTDAAHQAAAWKFEQFMLTPTAQADMQDVGQLSVLENLPTSDISSAENYIKIFDKQLRTAVARPPVPKYNQIDTDLGNAVALAAQGKGTIAQNIDAVLPEINSLLAQK